MAGPELQGLEEGSSPVRRGGAGQRVGPSPCPRSGRLTRDRPFVHSGWRGGVRALASQPRSNRNGAHQAPEHESRLRICPFRGRADPATTRLGGFFVANARQSRLMAPHASRLGPADTQPVRASGVLSAEAKLVWMEDWTLDRGGEGCWLSHAQIGERLGMTGHAVQYHRGRLADVGLYERMKRPGARSPGWRPCWPAGLPVLATQRPSPLEVAKARTFLDLHLRGKGLTARPPDDGGQTLRVRPPDVQSPAPRLSPPPSTAFDSQGERPHSTALSSTGNRVSPLGPESKAIEGVDLPQSVLPSIRPRSSESESEIETDIEPQPRAIDQRPRQEVEAEGWEKLRQRHAERRRQAGGP